MKPADIDSNPALQQSAKRKKRMSNNLQGGYVVAATHIAGDRNDDDNRQFGMSLRRLMTFVSVVASFTRWIGGFALYWIDVHFGLWWRPEFL